jgi:hypothetical protein
MLFECCDTLGRVGEDRRAVNALVVRLPQTALDMLGEIDLIAALAVMIGELHEREIR